MIKEYRESVGTVAALRKRISELEAALQLIAAMRGKCIFNFDPPFREGSALAFDQAADIAAKALASQSETETVK